MPKFDLAAAQVKQARLNEIAAELKTEFFGLDEIIDKVVGLVRAWYLMPEIITRPVIINLWGMTGVGKTQLVRSLVSKLGYKKKFVEIQMDGISSASYGSSSTIHAILTDSSVVEGEPGILLLDEMQRYRTIDDSGADMKVERYQDVWMLLSDGRFSFNASLAQEMEMLIAYANYHEDIKQAKDGQDDPDEVSSDEHPLVMLKRKYKIYPGEAKRYKKQLRLSETIEEIMEWTPEKVIDVMRLAILSDTNFDSDYTKLLVFISGNLDEVFRSAHNVNDCDTDADIYHKLTKLINTTDIKKGLGVRFKPEQISRFGNNNIIYPSMTKATYKKLIHSNCAKYIDEIEKLSGIKFTLTPRVYREIYENSVYPTQGTRPVFSSIHKILGSALSEFALWALENGIEEVKLSINPISSCLIGHGVNPKASRLTKKLGIELDIRETRKKNSIDFNTMVDVHEIGHALIYAILFKKAPDETKINLASFNGGYTMHTHDTTASKRQIRDTICVLMGGTMAEAMVFGQDHRSSSHASDMLRATQLASSYIRTYGFGEFSSVIRHPAQAVDMNGAYDSANESIEKMIEEEKMRALELLSSHKGTFIKLAAILLENKTLSDVQFVAAVDGAIDVNVGESVMHPYGDLFKEFVTRNNPFKQLESTTSN
jgi:hypothetical protein